MEEKVQTLEAKLNMLQATQDVVNEQFLHLKRENTALWQELANQRQKHLKQQQVTYKLLQFIMHSLVPNATAGARSNPNHHHRTTIHLGKRKLPALMQNDEDVSDGSGADAVAVAGPSPAKRVVPAVTSAAPTLRPSGPIISEILQRDTPSPNAPACHASVLPLAFASPLASGSGTPPPLPLSSSAMQAFAPQIQAVFSGASSYAESAFATSRHLTSAATTTATPSTIEGALMAVQSTNAIQAANADGLINMADLQTVTTGTLPDGTTVYLLSPAAESIVTTAPSLPPLPPPSTTSSFAPSSSNMIVANANPANSSANPAPDYRLEMDYANVFQNDNQPINLSSSTSNVTNFENLLSTLTKTKPKIVSNHARSLLNVNSNNNNYNNNDNGKSVGKAMPSKIKSDNNLISLAVMPSIISSAASAAGLSCNASATDASASKDLTLGDFISYESLMSGKRGMASPSPSKFTTMSPDDLFSTTDVSGAADAGATDANAADANDVSAASSSSTTVMEPPSFVDVFGLHSRQNIGSVKDAMLSASSSAPSVLQMPVNSADFFGGDHVDLSGGSSTSLLPASSSSALSIPSSASSSYSHPQNLAVSLSKQIENVDAGLDSIKDALVSHSSDLQMDPSELLNMFLPEGSGSFTTAPGSPMRWDDLFDLSDSAKDALSLALGPQKTLMGPPNGDSEDSNQ